MKNKLLGSLVVIFLSISLQSHAAEPQYEDKREIIPVTPSERGFMFGEMGEFLTALQKITKGLAENDMKAVEMASSAVSGVNKKKPPMPLRKKLPITFKKLGSKTHRQFEQLTLDAKQLGDKDHTLEQVAKIMENCLACHAMYQIKLIK